MKTGLAFIGGAILGATAGVVATKVWFNKNYEEVEDAQEDINSDTSVEENKQEKEEVVVRSTDSEEYKQMLQQLRYDRVLEKYNDEDEGNQPECCHDIVDECPPVVQDPSIPYRISREEFMAYDSYESDEYTLYADGYLTDSYGMPVSKEDIERLLGPNWMDLAEEPDEDSDEFCVRNELLKMDFNIVLDDSNFVEVAPNNIKRMMDIV